MEQIRTLLVFIAVLSVLVIAHEWGHFIAAKLCGMRVSDFSLFFGKKILRLGERNGTEYNIRSIPLGGFVKIDGMEPEDIANGATVINPAGKKKMRVLLGFKPELIEAKESDISPTVVDTVYNAIGDDNTLTANGRKQLIDLLAIEATTEPDRAYIDGILSAVAPPPDPQAYNQKSLLQRAIVIFAGPLASFLLGYLIFVVMGFTTGLPTLGDKVDPVIGMVVPDKVASKAGMQTGDRITAIEGKPIAEWSDLVKAISDRPNKPTEMQALRDGKPVTFHVTPVAEQMSVTENGKTFDKNVGRLGIGVMFSWKRADSPIAAMKQGTQIIANQVETIVRTLFSRSAPQNLSGPLGIVGKINEDTHGGFSQVLLTAAQLSVSLGVFNLLPIPILDGGHLLLLGIEGVRRRRLAFHEVIAAQKVGLVIIGSLFLFVMYNDLKRIFFKG